jgi:hypothetical protein
MSPFSNNKRNRKKSIDELSSVCSGGDVDPTAVSTTSVIPGDSDRSIGIVAETKRVGNLCKKPGILRSKMGQRDKSTNQAPPQHYQQHYPQGYISGYPTGTMPMQLGMAPPGVMPFMMPPSYYGCSSGYDYTCRHPSIQSVDVSDDEGEGCDYSYDSTCNSSRTTTLCAEGLARIVRKTVDSVTNSVNDVLDCGANVADYAEESLCEPVICEGNNVGGGTPSTIGLSASQSLASRSLASRSTLQDNADLLEKIDKLYKLVSEKEEALREGIQEKKELNPLDALDESAITHHSVTKLIGVDQLESFSADAEDTTPGPVKAETRAIEGGDNVEELISLFSDSLLVEDQQIKAASKQDKSTAFKAVENGVIYKHSKNFLTKLRLGRSRTKMRSRSRDNVRFIPFKSCPAMNENVTIEKESFVDSRFSPLVLPSPDEKLLMFPSRVNNFSSGNSYADHGISSPVSIAASLETRSCAWCGLGGSNTKDVKKLKVCSACKSTYYCSSECQSNDWIDGHANACQEVSRVNGEHDSAL